MVQAWNDPGTYVLALEIEHLEELEAVFGEGAIAHALEDLGEGFRRIGAKALARHAPLTVAASQYPGRWLAPFQMRTSKPRSDPDEQREAIAASARQPGRSLFQEVFGTASGARVGFKVAVVEAPDREGDIDGRLDIAFAAQEPEVGCCVDGAKGELDRIVAERDIRTFLQPVVSFPAGEIVGFEALARGPAGGPLERPDQLFSTANRAGVGRDLELIAIERALEAASDLPPPYWLSINASPDLLTSTKLLSLAGEAAQRGLAGRLVVELTEHMPLDEAERLRSAAAELGKQGVRLALDDTGCGYADLRTAEVLAPDIVKLCITIIRQLEPDADIIDDITATVVRLDSLGATTLAEGVETAEQARVLQGTGVGLAQGFHYGQPVPALEALMKL